ncbi:MAG TPA: type 4a pilus biogenesis protein PilO [Armatimonadota bacterium]|nr:type 4a pilus biogenesis protein PilO [Armatimonadota bacterium]
MVNLPLKITRKVLITLIASMVLELAALTGFYVQQNSMVTALEASLQERQTELSSAKTLTAQLLAEQQKVNVEKGQLAQLEGALPTKEYVPTLLTQLQALATSTHNTILSITPNLAPPPPAAPPPSNVPTGNPTTGATAKTDSKPAAPAAPPYDKYLVTMGVQGGYRDVMTFLLRLTQFPKIISVDQCQLSNLGATNGTEGVVTANLKFTGYILKEN